MWEEMRGFSPEVELRGAEANKNMHTSLLPVLLRSNPHLLHHS